MCCRTLSSTVRKTILSTKVTIKVPIHWPLRHCITGLRIPDMKFLSLTVSTWREKKKGYRQRKRSWASFDSHFRQSFLDTERVCISKWKAYKFEWDRGSGGPPSEKFWKIQNRTIHVLKNKGSSLLEGDNCERLNLLIINYLDHQAKWNILLYNVPICANFLRVHIDYWKFCMAKKWGGGGGGHKPPVPTPMLFIYTQKGNGTLHTGETISSYLEA